MTHFIEKCRFCNIIVSECRCMSKDKQLRWVICKECKKTHEPNIQPEPLTLGTTIV